MLEGREDMARPRVLLADDNEMILARVRSVLGEDFDIVGAVGTGQDAIAEVQRLKPDVLVIDISMPILTGLEAVTRLRFKSQTKTVFLTVHEDPEVVAAAFEAGASAYVTKSHLSTDLIPAIREALEGGKYISKLLSS
jgi:DNA-binding NarL/FixJ family response regulator